MSEICDTLYLVSHFATRRETQSELGRLHPGHLDEHDLPVSAFRYQDGAQAMRPRPLFAGQESVFPKNDGDERAIGVDEG